ncbi:MAG TPA: ArsA-related P-loop ATPase [Polyangia bacterium]|nr:ArsA-related P-loop ATPase [Polyangia bacterium]
MSLFDKRLVVVGGKGGVGRTTVAAALAVAAVRKGKRVLLCQTKSKERLSSLFDVPRVGTDLVRLRDRLWGVNMTPQAALREYGAMVLRSEFIAKQVLENKVSRSFLRAVPGLEDYAMLGKTWFHTTEEDDGGRAKWDLVILDGPATGHLVTMLAIPQSILDAIPEGPLTRPAASTLSLLRDPLRSALVLVTLAEDLPSNEAVELKRKIDATVKMPWGPLVVNLLYPPRFATGPSARAVQSLPEDVGDPELQPLVSSARTAQRRRALNDRYLERLKRDVPLPQVHLPYLFTPRFDYAALEELSRRLEGQVAAAPEVTAAAVGEK